MGHPAGGLGKPRIHIRTSVRLTGTELRVLGSIAEGHGRKRVSEDMHIDREQIRCHLGSAYGKLKVKNIGAAVRAAQELGLIPVDPRGSLSE
jgi:DNA-binding CsgD family transcriptional regulator